jgi:L,D-transpeptidase catalytic domain
MSSHADTKFSKRIFWFGLAVVIVVAIIAIVRVDALRASAIDSKNERPSTPLASSESSEKASISSVSSVSPVEAEPLLEKTGLTENTSNPKLLDDQFAVKRILEFDEPFVHGFWIWDDENIPDGEITITVDLKAESMSVFRDGYEIGAAVISFGDALKPTPTGVFPITQKSRDHISNIYGTPMPYMLRMTNDGISIHGANVRWGWGTRGCIGVPTEFAAKLFEQVKLGDRVIVTNGKMLHVG